MPIAKFDPLWRHFRVRDEDINTSNNRVKQNWIDSKQRIWLDDMLVRNVIVQKVDALTDLCKPEGFARNLSLASKVLHC